METTIKISNSFKEIFDSNCNEIYLPSGRVSGKTKIAIIYVALSIMQYPFTDVVMGRANYGSLGDSLFNEIQMEIGEMPYFADNCQFKRSPFRVVVGNDTNEIIFMGYGGSNMSRTKGLKTKHPVKVVILDETQELKDRESLEQALASMRRNFGKDCKVFIIGNPPAQQAHWFNMMISEKEKDASCLVKRTSWQDIIPFLNDYDLEAILKMEKTNKAYYDWFYMGECSGGFGSVYPMFLKEKYLINTKDLFVIRSQLKVVCCLIGGDGAVNRDCTSFVPLLILNNGQCIVGDIFYHNPQENQVIGSHTLVQNLVTKWFNELCVKYNLGTINDLRNNPYGVNQITPIYMRIDSAATDLIQECRYFFGDRADVGAVKKSTIVEMVSNVQSAISNDMVYIIEENKYFNYFQNKSVKIDLNLLATQLSMLIWNEKQDGYDPIVPNDVCDAFTYAIRSWYSNVENIQWFNILKENKMQLPMIKDLIGKGVQQ